MPLIRTEDDPPLRMGGSKLADYIAIVEALRDGVKRAAENQNDHWLAEALDAILRDARRYRTIRRGGLPVIERGFYMLAISQACDAAVDRMAQDQGIIDAAMGPK